MYLRKYEIFKLDPTRFFSAYGLAWQTALKKIKVKVDILTDIGTSHSIYLYPKANNKYMTDYDKY